MVESCPVCKWSGIQMARLRENHNYVAVLPFLCSAIWNPDQISNGSTIWKPDIEKSGIRVLGIQMVPVTGLPERTQDDTVIFITIFITGTNQVRSITNQFVLLQSGSVNYCSEKYTWLTLAGLQFLLNSAALAEFSWLCDQVFHHVFYVISPCFWVLISPY